MVPRGGDQRARDRDRGAVAIPDREVGLGQELRVVLDDEGRGREHRYQASHLVLGLERRHGHPVEGEQDEQEEESEYRVGVTWVFSKLLKSQIRSLVFGCANAIRRSTARPAAVPPVTTAAVRRNARRAIKLASSCSARPRRRQSIGSAPSRSPACR